MKHTFAAVCIVLCAAAIGLSADTLILKDGTRLVGRVVGMRNDVVEFEESGSRRRVSRHQRDDIRRLEFSDDDDSRDARGDRDRPQDRRPAGLLRRDVRVAATTQWVNTGITVRAGDNVYFDASGEVHWGPNREDGPVGERNSPSNPGRPIPASPAAALIGRVGDRGTPFLNGDQPGPYRMRNSGQLFLGINDDVLTDNRGAFTVTIQY
jgi:hypothetical protein